MLKNQQVKLNYLGFKKCKGIKYIRYLVNEDKNQKSDFYKTEKVKNKIVSEIKIKKRS